MVNNLFNKINTGFFIAGSISKILCFLMIFYSAYFSGYIIRVQINNYKEAHIEFVLTILWLISSIIFFINKRKKIKEVII